MCSSHIGSISIHQKADEEVKKATLLTDVHTSDEQMNTKVDHQIPCDIQKAAPTNERDTWINKGAQFNEQHHLYE